MVIGRHLQLSTVRTVAYCTYISEDAAQKSRYRSTISYTYPKNNGLLHKFLWPIAQVSLNILIKEIGVDPYFSELIGKVNWYR